MRSITAESSRLPVGLFGEQKKSSLVPGRQRSRIAASSSAKPRACSRGTSTTAAPWIRAATSYMPNVGGNTMMRSCCARQNARTSRSMASSLPRPTSTRSDAHAVELGQAPDQPLRLRLGVAVQSGGGVVTGARHGSSLACRRSSVGSHSAWLVRHEVDQIRAGDLQHGAHATLPSAERAQADRDRIAMRIESLQVGERARRRTKLAQARRRELLYGDVA